MITERIKHLETKTTLREQFGDVLNGSLNCKPGWYRIVADMLSDMIRQLEYEGYARDHLRVTRISEKYATLRCNYTAPVDLDRIVERYELQSSLTCEECGRLGRLREAEWVLTLCDRCAIEHNVPFSGLHISEARAGLHINFRELDNRQIAVQLINPSNTNRESMQLCERNDVPLAVANLLAEMLREPVLRHRIGHLKDSCD